MFKIRFDSGISAAEQKETTTACGIVEAMSRDLVRGIGSERYEKYCRRWFGSFDRNRIAANVRRMDAVIANPEITVTFVSRQDKNLNAIYGGINVPPATIDPANSSSLEVRGTRYGTAKPNDTSLTSVYAFVFPAQGGGSALMSHHVGSGIRLYLANVYFALPHGDAGRAHTIYHELTHKTLGTEDHMYEAQPCYDMATSQPHKAGTNADSYAFFATTYHKLVKIHV
jgi:hypothetical protein